MITYMYNVQSVHVKYKVQLLRDFVGLHNTIFVTHASLVIVCLVQICAIDEVCTVHVVLIMSVCVWVDTCACN